MKKLDPARMRWVVLIVGLAVLGVLALVMFARGVDRVEAIATLLFVPVFVAFVLGKVAGGLAMGVVAAGAYAALRYPAIDAVGIDRFAGLIASRALGYIVFGGVGGWATQALEASLRKLDLFDRIDDDTGLLNARAIVHDLDLETARSKRYKTIFSLSLVDVSTAALDSISSRKRRKILRGLGDVLKRSVRTMDRVAYATDGQVHRFVLLLPETEAGGIAVLSSRLVQGVTEHLKRQGTDVSPDTVTVESITYPDDPEELLTARTVLFEIARKQFPEDASHPASAAAVAGQG